MEEKKCSKCGYIKPITDFHKRKANKDGISCVCKTCKNNDRQNNRWKYKDREVAYRVKYNKKNKQKIRERTHTSLMNKREEEGIVVFTKFNRHSILRSVKYIDKKIWDKIKDKKNIAGIYMIRSLLKWDKFYIGSSVDILQRWNEHKSDLSNHKHRNPKLQNYCNKYGLGDLCFFLIEICSDGRLIKREQYYIDLLNPYFNINKIAGNSLGRRHSKETKKKISEKNKNKVVSEETKKRQSDSHKGLRKSEGWKRKIGTANRGRKLSKATKIKISKARLGKKLNLTESQRDKRREIALRFLVKKNIN